MALNLDLIKSRLNSLSNVNNKQINIWKPSPGKQVIRIVPYKFNAETPFIELKFHYGINNKSYLSPSSFGRPDPIVEFSEKLKRTGDKEEWKYGKKIEPKMRTFAPIIVRGLESEGVKFWGFGKTVYEELLSVMADPEYGDITDLVSGRDIVVEFKTATETATHYPETSVRAKPNQTPAVDTKNKELVAKIQNQINVLDLFPELSYAELKTIMEEWLNSEAGESDKSEPTIDVETPPTDVVVATIAKTKTADKVVTPKTTSIQSTDDAAKAFDTLFNS